MTYLTFLLLFLLAPILILATAHGWLRKGAVLSDWKWIGVVCIIAFVYTTPWDNYLVYREVWYYGEARVIGTIGFVPVEEYIFFILQPILTGLWVYLLIEWVAKTCAQLPSSSRSHLMYSSLWLSLALAGVFMLFDEDTLYLGLILAWAGPVLAGMAWLSTPTFLQHRSVWLIGIAVPTLYLWVVDRFAITNGIWDISNSYSLDIDPLGLPIEEAVFFLVTNILVVQGLLMFDPPQVLKRARLQ